MNSVNYIFLIRNGIIVPQSLEDEHCGGIINSLMSQGFSLSDFNTESPDSSMALKLYYSNNYQ